MAQRVRAAVAGVTGRARVVFTAHSLPERVRAAGDPYPDQLEESARLVATEAGLTDWLVAWQSAGRTPEPWLGPDIRDEVRRLAAEGETDAVVVCPIGFVADHLEVLYDLDIELAAVASSVGLAYARTASLNDDPAFIAVTGRRRDGGGPGRLTWAGGQVVVVGGGISGLSAAWELTGGAEPAGEGPAVVAPRGLGPARRCSAQHPLRWAGGGHGARWLPRSPHGGASSSPGTWGSVTHWSPSPAGAPRSLPGAGCAPCPRAWPSACPPGSGRRRAAASSGPRGRLGLLRDALLPRPDVRGPLGDRSIGPLVTRKLGSRVTDALVDPLIGGIHAGSVDDMSAAAVFPPLLAAAGRRGSLMRALRSEMPAPDPDGPPLFWALEGGMEVLVVALADALRRRGVDIRLGEGATSLDRQGDRWSITTTAAAYDADGVVLAVPAPGTAACSGRTTTRRPHCSMPSTTPR